MSRQASALFGSCAGASLSNDPLSPASTVRCTPPNPTAACLLQGTASLGARWMGATQQRL
jgi:hypothetical protein